MLDVILNNNSNGIPVILDFFILGGAGELYKLRRDAGGEDRTFAPHLKVRAARAGALFCRHARHDHLRVELRIHHSNNAMMKPRLFSTLQCLRHENPLVCLPDDASKVNG
jgi:hypothetical protein